MLHIPVCEYLILKMNMQVITTKVRCSEMHGERAAAAGGQSTVHLAPRARVLAVAEDICVWVGDHFSIICIGVG